MTNEEKAIYILENTNFHFDGESDPEGITAQNFCTAYNIAIRSLAAWTKVKEELESYQSSDTYPYPIVSVNVVLGIINKYLEGIEDGEQDQNNN